MHIKSPLDLTARCQTVGQLGKAGVLLTGQLEGFGHWSSGLGFDVLEKFPAQVCLTLRP